MTANPLRSRAAWRRPLPIAFFLARLSIAWLLILTSTAPLSAAALSSPTWSPTWSPAAASPRAAESQAAVAAGAFVPGEVLIGWQPNSAPSSAGQSGWPSRASAQAGRAATPGTPQYEIAAQAITARTGLPVLAVHLDYSVARLSVPPGQEQAEIARLAKLPGVRYAEPNYIAYAAGIPSDPLYPEQWNLARVNAPLAWDMTVGSNSVVVAVIDSGIASSHPEFAGRLLFGPGTGSYKYTYPPSEYPIDDYGHGTHVAGILAAGMNGIGVVGLAPGVRILPLKVLDSQGKGDFDTVATAVYRASNWTPNLYPGANAPNARVRVINLSLGAYSAPNQTLHDAVDYARSQGILVVAAAGNCSPNCHDGANLDFYPAVYNGVLAVGATGPSDEWANYSGYKPYVGISAPGGLANSQILSTLPYTAGSSGYGYDYGTSMATPLVSGAAALAASIWTDATPADLTTALTSSADKVPISDPVCAYDGVGFQHSPCFGYGRLNAQRAARWAYPPSLRPVIPQPRFLFGRSDALTRRTYSDALLNPSDRVASWQASVVGGAQWLSVLPDPNGGPTPSTYSSPGILSISAQPGQLPAGNYTGLIQVQSVYPPELATNFNITVTLVVTDSLYQVYTPVLSK
jgi:hypothetical protein